MKAIQMSQFGGKEVLEWVSIPTPEPKEGEVLVKIHAAGVNPVDWKIREGKLQGRMPHEFPVIPGWEFSGVVEARGHAARRFEIGDEVFSYCRRPTISKGAYAEWIAIPESYLAKKSKAMSFEESAGTPLAGLTAYQCLFQLADCKAGNTVLILGASGGVGSFAVQLAKNVGATVIGLAGPENQEFLKNEWKVDLALNYKNPDWKKEFLHSYPKGADLVMDFVGGPTFQDGVSCLHSQGRIVSILESDFSAIPNVSAAYHFVEPNAKHLETLSRLADEGKLKTYVSRTFPLSKAAEAMEEIGRFHTRGKIVLNV
ncbi:NADP-dependent oxidoreductase [Leptospira yasudae]|uniref:NADP-dependent oxidoreductase n=1 Tax=Leptospira yasudae TaxID=2202201 RepID=A0ABX9LYC8_9LEPT|nr:NADP-dependent oxidoreductase [Leptospira yasudae]RHX77899.1 NADP-dependent oxidoreductase [Leptospira yasudae]TGK23153.1 NADP-dependent oxidoreductase [Leptospira yasudae]TGM00407.1 NADP-dependent oxidoreductase [Leptospira yasudae]